MHSADSTGSRGRVPTQRIDLEVSPEFVFHAGQYLGIRLDGLDDMMMSIASAPHRLPNLELHYRPTPGDAQSEALDRLLRDDTQLHLSGPYGDVRVSRDEDCLLIAGGTGASQAFAIARDRAHRAVAGRTDVLWCADTKHDLYAVDELQALATLTTVVDDQRRAANAGLQWLRTHAGVMRDANVVICGSPGFVYAVHDVLLEVGFAPSALQADVYSYAPRA